MKERGKKVTEEKKKKVPGLLIVSNRPRMDLAVHNRRGRLEKTSDG